MAEVRPGLVSVMMPAHNAEAYIGEAIESLRAQSYPDWELVVVDDGSTDQTAAIVAGQSDGRVSLHSQAGQGEAAARNRALALLRGEWIAFLDADDRFLPDHLARAVETLAAAPGRDAVYSDGFYMDESGRRGERLSSRRRGPFDGDLFDPLVRASDVFGPPICTVLRRRPVIDRRLSFDPRIVIGPDWDFLTRFAERATFSYLPEATCLYRQHRQSITAQTDGARRRSSLAQCRMNAILLDGFERCSPETQSYAFYDLLVNLLTGEARRQAEVTAWPQFNRLPARERARLYRRMATESLARGTGGAMPLTWLEQSVALAPQDLRSRVLHGLFHSSPRVGLWLLRLRSQAGRAAPPASV